MSKRARGLSGQVVVPRARRPIDKSLVTIEDATMPASSFEQIIKTTAFPCTVTGLRWEITARSLTAASAPEVAWAIVVDPDGNGVQSLSVAPAGATFYTPEQNVMAFGIAKLGDPAKGANLVHTWTGSTKTMRKLKVGDNLSFLGLNDSAENVAISGVIQFFCKT